MSHRACSQPARSGGARWRLNTYPYDGPGSHGHQVGPAGRSIAWLPSLVRKGVAPLQRAHLCYRKQILPPPRLHLILLDTSGSMRRRGQLALAKGYAAMLIERAARAGDHVALLSFGGKGVELLLPARPARLAGCTRVRSLGGGGGTPLAQALVQAELLLRHAVRRSSPASDRPWIWLLTDGRTLEQPSPPRAAQHIVLVDFDQAVPSLGRCSAWATRWGAEYRRPVAAALPIAS